MLVDITIVVVFSPDADEVALTRPLARTATALVLVVAHVARVARIDIVITIALKSIVVVLGLLGVAQCDAADGLGRTFALEKSVGCILYCFLYCLPI